MASQINYENYTFLILMVDFKSSVSNTKPCPRLKPGSKSQKSILQRPFNFEKYELAMSSFEKIFDFSRCEVLNANYFRVVKF